MLGSLSNGFPEEGPTAQCSWMWRVTNKNTFITLVGVPEPASLTRSHSAPGLLEVHAFLTTSDNNNNDNEMPQLHNSGKCRPCAHGKDCRRGSTCHYCHICEPGSLRKRARANKGVRKVVE
ncbi:unnamed protein product [Polarella glacialis]|uniref:C3H1-type domain-containing protein n=1 Tax=Polarella glacialis TaxID=89957 RepID=A0A813JXF7_POLGL|nr:unnamed protein product [Polarella glacialis]